jgi:uncharacterized membrane protein
MTRKAVRVAVAGALLVYPLAMYLAADYLTPSQFLAGLLALLAARVLLAAWFAPYRARVIRQVSIALLLFAAAIATLLFAPNVRMGWLRLYPMLFDLGVCVVFFGSLFTDRPLVERFARLFRGGDLPAEAVAYTRIVTRAWSGLLLLIAAVSAYTAMAASFRVWSLFNGVIVYVIIGVAFGCEYVTRTCLRRRWEAA